MQWKQRRQKAVWGVRLAFKGASTCRALNSGYACPRTPFAFMGV